MNIWASILKCFGWEVKITAEQRNKCVICVAPHTSNWDFIIGLLAYRSKGRKANFLMKKFWFFFPLGILLKHLGGIPVNRKPKQGKSSYSLTESIISRFKETDYMNLAVTPEGTRSARAEWKTGFIYIALGAGVPIQLGIIDYKNKQVIINDEFIPTGDVQTDIELIKTFYSNYKQAAKYPENFLTF
ncbi:MAG: acyltransferase [Bacteroidales bacterium]|nr:acyltransferase [Bacteroidales bacterium]MBD5348497.1 acyltransferase [Bacteroides sp.]